MEKFVIIGGFEMYAVSNYGRVKNVKTGRILITKKNSHGYIECTLCQNNVKKTFRIHRLVALYFVDNPSGKPYVNHIDGDKANNYYLNLEWCTAAENQFHARTTGLINQTRPIIAEDVQSGEKIPFISISEAAGILGINKGTIHKVLSGKRQKVHGYRFYYV